MPAVSAASRDVARQTGGRGSGASSSAGTYELSANWGAIAVTLCALPWVALFALNPLSLFFVVFWGVALTFASFLPKLVHYMLLELAIAQGRGTDFYERNHARRIRGAFPAFALSLRFMVNDCDTRICVCVCMCVCVCVCVVCVSDCCVCVCVCVCVNVYMHCCMYTNTYVCANTKGTYLKMCT